MMNVVLTSFLVASKPVRLMVEDCPLCANAAYNAICHLMLMSGWKGRIELDDNGATVHTKDLT